MTDLAINFERNIRPLLDAVDRLRNLKVTSEGIPLPSIVVVGDQSSGKSSVLESLATISLPRGQGIATRVPLVLRLQSCRSNEETSIKISYGDETLDIDEDQIESAVDTATNSLAGMEKGVSDTPISLHVRKPGAPDLTMIDLPGITRVPIHGQPDNIYEQISGMIRHYLEPKETVILNVLSATVDFSTCESIRMSREEDKEGERTLAVVTKVDRAPEGVYEKVTTDEVNIGLGYICVRNRTDEDASHEEARENERQLFETHPFLSQLDRASVGISSLAERLTRIQANIIRSNLPVIQQQIEKALGERQKELEVFTRGLPGDGDPTDAFLKIADDNRTLMQEVMLNGNYDSFVDNNEMHYPARLADMFQTFSDKFDDALKDILPSSKTEEIVVRMAEMRGLTLPNFLSPTLMRTLVSEEIDKVSAFCTDLVPRTHAYAKNFAFNVIDKSMSAFPHLQAAYKTQAQNVLTSSHDACIGFVRRALRKERGNVFTMNDYYMANVRKIQDRLAAVKISAGDGDYGNIDVEGFKDPVNLQEVHSMSNDYQSAYDMKVNLVAYWKVVHKRMADEIPLEIRFSLESALLESLRNGVLKAKMGHDMSALMEEHASTLQKKLILQKRVDVLKESREVLEALI